MVKQWAFVPDYEQYYQVNTDGCVKSLERVVLTKKGAARTVKGKILRPKRNGKGYQFVTLCKDATKRNFYVHRLVALAFISNPENLPYVNHKDGNPSNNDFANLEWVSHSANVKHAYDAGLNSNKGANHGFAVGVIDNELGEKFDTVKEWAVARGINYSTGRNLLNGYSKSKNVNQCMIIKLNKEENEVTNTQ